MREFAPPSTDYIGAYPRKRYAPINRCIYCGTTESDLTDEHIIPFGLLPKGMDLFLPKSSCRDCAKITSKFEGSVQQGMLGPLRHKMGLKTRRKRPTTHNVTFNFRQDGRLEYREIALVDFPAMCMGFRWLAPGILRRIAPTNIFEGELVVRQNPDELKKFIGDGEAFKIGRVAPGDFARMLAKIAHSFAMAELGADAFEPLLPDLILGKSETAPYLVGGDATEESSSVELPLHYLGPMYASVDEVLYLLIAIRLFSKMGMPRYHVVVGRSTQKLSFIQQTSHAKEVKFPVSIR